MTPKLTIGELEKDYNVDFKARKDMKLSTWLKRRGYKSLAKCLEHAEV